MRFVKQNFTIFIKQNKIKQKIEVYLSSFWLALLSTKKKIENKLNPRTFQKETNLIEHLKN